MAGFNITNHGAHGQMAAQAGINLPSEWDALEPWALSVAQCTTIDQVKALADRLYRRIEYLRSEQMQKKVGFCPSIQIEREAIALCAARVSELTAQAVKALPDAFGHRT